MYHKVISQQTEGDYITGGAGNGDHYSANKTTENGIFKLYARPNYGNAQGQGSMQSIMAPNGTKLETLVAHVGQEMDGIEEITAVCFIHKLKIRTRKVRAHMAIEKVLCN